MILYSQRDPRWSSHALGWGPALGTIGAYGCFDSVLAMIATDSGHVLNPAQLDEAFTAAQLFVRDPTGTFDLLPDNALAQLFPDRYQVTAYGGFRGDLITAAMPTPDTYAVLWISTAAVPTHFVLAYSKGPNWLIADPWTGTVGQLAGYGGPNAVHKTLLIKALPVAAPPQPKPAPVVPAPVPSPTPAPPAAPAAPAAPTQPPIQEVPPVATNPAAAPPPAPIPVPTQPIAIPVPDVPEPTPVAEQGVTTSEWALVVRYLYQAAAVGTAAVVTKAAALVGLHFTIPPDLLAVIVTLEVTGAVGVGTYALSRGIRKAGAN